MNPDAFRNFVAQAVAAIEQPIPPLVLTVTCKGCGQKNRRVIGRIGARCGKCGLPLAEGETR